MERLTQIPTSCSLCPRRCGADRTVSRGLCGGGGSLKVARAMLHLWEEPLLTGGKGAGAVFFSGCPLKCRYCQNLTISRDGFGVEVTAENGGLSGIFSRLTRAGAATLDLVTPTQWLPWIETAVAEWEAAGLRTIPVVCNTGGYERVETLRRYAHCFDVYLPDFKYRDPRLARAASDAEDYFDVALAAVREMVRQTGAPVVRGGVLQRGVLIRHLVLPGHRADSIAVLETIASEFGGDVLVSVMRQYTPPDEPVPGLPELSRRVTTFEYESVLEAADRLGVNGFMQERSSARREYTPDWNGDLFTETL